MYNRKLITKRYTNACCKGLAAVFRLCRFEFSARQKHEKLFVI
ncbi:hypothetical protein HMPREF9554_00119 [Treponema phagedenis F0421]|nr:hypothetical protein HMPREF9554_00119 [Treponema phagedenis F0421]